MASDTSNEHQDVNRTSDADGRLMPSELVAVDDATLLEQVVGYYHRSLVADAVALKWLDGQGLSSTGDVEHFRLGLANRTLGPRLSKADRKTRRRLRSRLQQLGVLRPSGHEHLNGCIVVPLVDAAGRVVELYGRRFGRGLQSGAKQQVWTSDAPHGLLSAGAFDGDEVIVTASIFGALRLWVAGRRNVTALSDIEGSVSELCRAVAALRTRRVVVALPQPEASDRLTARLRKAGVAEVQCVQLPEQVRANGFVSAVEDGLATLGSAMKATGVPEPEAAPPTPEPSEATEVERLSAAPTPDGDELVLSFTDRRWRVRGLSSNKARGTLRVNIFLSRPGVGFHVDVLDVCIARQRNAFVRLASQELCADEVVIKKDMGQVLLALELAQDELLRHAEEPRSTVPAMTEREKTAALDLLRDSALLDRVLADLERLGVVGERTNLLLAYLASVSRKLPAPLGLIVQSSSASGKSSLVQSVLSLVPDEDRMSYSMMTGQSLYYMGATSLRHKVLSIAEDRGVARASYALKLLQSEGALQIATTSKDPASGRLASEQYRVEGPIALMLTTTAVDLDEELLSRCLVLAVDETPQQTRRIHEHQRWLQTLQGLRAREQRDEVLALHRNAQRLLRSLPVVNPHADALEYGDLRVRARRDHRKLLGLIEALALVHQHQRTLQKVEVAGRVVEAVPVERSDIELASRLIAGVTPGIDDLPIQTRRLLASIDEHVQMQAHELQIHRDHVRFSRRQLRECLAVGNSQLKVHLRRLVDAELVVAHATARGRGVVYSLAIDRLADTRYDDVQPGSGRGAAGPRPGGGRAVAGPPVSAKSSVVADTSGASGPRQTEKRTSGSEKRTRTRNVPAPKEVG